MSNNLCTIPCYNKTELGYCKTSYCLFAPVVSYSQSSVTTMPVKQTMVKTNGDRLRSMPDEDLAKAIARMITGCYGCHATNELECAECVLERLKEET